MSEKVVLPLQDMIDYKSEVIARLASSQEVVGLLLDDPNIDIEDEDTWDRLEGCFFDFDYIDRTVQRHNAFIVVEADMESIGSGSFNDWELYVQVICSRDYMKLDPKTFKGVKGNRRDNLMCEVDRLLNGTEAFGLRKLELRRANTAVVPDSFTSKLLTYAITETRRERFGSKY